MAGVLEYSTTPGSNTSINSIGIQGSDPVLNFDNAARQIMADIASQITRRVAKSTAYTVLKTDHGQLIECTATLTLSMTAAATLTDGFYCIVKANGGTVTIDPASSEQIDGASTKSISDGGFAFIFCSGTAFHTISLTGTLSAIGALTPTDGNIIVGDGSSWVAESGATARTSLGAQAQGDVLDDLNTLGAASADGEFIVATGAGAFAYESGDTALTSLGGGTTGIAIFKDSTAAAVRTEIGLVIGTDVQAYDADLTTYASNPLTAAELGELQNIGTTTISATQWGYVGALDQGLTTTSNATFADLAVTGALTVTGNSVGFDAGQTWQDVFSSRAEATSYQNTTGAPIEVVVTQNASGSTSTSQTLTAEVSVDDSTWITVGTATNNNNSGGSVSFVVPKNWYYKATSGTTLSNWTELR